MNNNEKSVEIVTDNPISTDTNGLYVLGWRSIFRDAYLQKSVPIRNYAPIRNFPALFSRLNQWVAVPANPTASQGAASICTMLRSFATLVDAAQCEMLPAMPLAFDSPGGESWEIECPGLAVLEIERHWTARARECVKVGRSLTSGEESALEMATAFLDGIVARWDGDQWRDLDLMAAEQDEAFKATHSQGVTQ